MSKVKRARVMLALARLTILQLIVRATAVYDAMLANAAIFTAPTVPLTQFLAQIQALVAAQQKVATRVLGAAATRDEQLAIVIHSLERLADYVQSIADANPEKASSIIHAAAMKMAMQGVYTKPVLDVLLGMVDGSVHLRANASALHKGRKARCFNWQYTTDGGKTWISAPTTTVAHTVIDGLPLLTTCGFRVSVTDSDGQGEWTQTVSLLVQ